MFIPKDICPVPFDQQPLNEYISLKKSWFFSSVTFEINKYFQIILVFTVLLFIAFIPFVLSGVPNAVLNLKLFIIDLIIVNLILISIFIRLYLGWSYVMKRLLSAIVFYEESGWYDGQLWIKTPEMITKDRLIGLYEIDPLLKRINYTLFIMMCLLVIEGLIYYLL